MRFSGFLGKVTYAVSANVLSLLVSVLTTLLVPRLLGVDEFGYFQLYLFYSSYVGLLHFGWNDGVLLRLGGSRYEELPRESIFSQFMVLVAEQFVAGVTVALVGIWVVDGSEMTYIILMTSICVLISGPMYMLMFILQATARIKEYARITIIQRVLFGLLVVVISLSPFISFELLIVAELFSRLIALTIALYLCRHVVFLSARKLFWPGQEILANLGGGFPLLVSAMSGALIIGAVRFGIAENWSIAVFRKVSLSLSLATMVLTTIVAVGQVLFPLLRRVSSDHLPRIYSTGRMILSSLTLPALLTYFLLVPFVSYWLPEYRESARYLGIIFPMFIYQVRTAVLLEPYLKALRYERILLGVNLGVLFLSFLATWAFTYVLEDLTASLISIVLLVALRAIILEAFVARLMSFRFAKPLFYEGVIILIFLWSVLYLQSGWAAVVLGNVLAAWFLMHRKELKAVVQFVR